MEKSKEQAVSIDGRAFKTKSWNRQRQESGLGCMSETGRSWKGEKKGMPNDGGWEAERVREER